MVRLHSILASTQGTGDGWPCDIDKIGSVLPIVPKGVDAMDLSALLSQHGYWILAVGCLLEGETVLVMAGFAAHRGQLDIAWVFVIAATCGFLGDSFFFWLGRYHGAKVMARWPTLAAQSQRLNAWTVRFHGWVIVGLRFAYGLRIAGPVLIGMSPIPAWRFQGFNALGAILWASVISGIGWFFGHAAQWLLGEIRHLEGWFLLAMAASGLGLWGWRHWRMRLGRASGKPGDDPGPPTVVTRDPEAD
jgi:membrane protein DedA with SNARE-associated domain